MSALRLARLSSARRRLPGRHVGRLVLALLAVLVLVLVCVELQRGPRHAPTAPAPTARSAPPGTTPTATPARSVPPSPTPALVVASSGWLELSEATATPSPWPTSVPEAPRPTATQVAEPWECVQVTWTAQQGLGRLGEVLVEIEALNSCSRDLEPLDLWFQVSGYRDGALVRSVCGHPMQRIYRGHSERVAIGLPGSLDWYDRVEVRPVGPGCL